MSNSGWIIFPFRSSTVGLLNENCCGMIDNFILLYGCFVVDVLLFAILYILLLE
jgi:hypothetical protein